MDSSLLQSQGGGLADDLSALAWVHEELRKSLDAAHKALRRCLKDVTQGQSDMDALDPAILRTARLQIHQGVGALELAGLSAGAAMLRASEAVVNKFVARPASITASAVDDIEQASFALLDYIARKLAGKPIAATELFPQYESLMARAGQGLPRPTDLWAQDWPTLSLEAPLAAPPGTSPRAADAATVEDFEMGLLGLLRRQQPQDALDLAALCAGLAAQAEGRKSAREAATWMLASGFLEGLAGRHVALDVHSKRVLSQLLRQLRVLVKGKATPSDRLANELLFFCAQARDVEPQEQSVLARVRRTFGLERHHAVNLDASILGRYDPSWVTQAAKRVAAAKDGWSAVAGGEMLRLSGLNEQFALVADSLHRLFPQGDVLANALTDSASATSQSAQPPEASLAMEVATSLLYVEACIEDCEFDHPEQAERLARLAERIRLVASGQPAEPLEAWMEDLYRRVSDRQTIGSVVHELRLSLSDCEKHIDQYFREPSERGHLVQVPAALQSMRGVLAVLGLDHASHAVVRMSQDVDQLLQPETDLDQAAEHGVFDRVATNLGALGFLIDMMGVQPSLARTLFAWDADKGILNPLMAREKKTPLSTDDPVEAVAQHVQAVQREEAQSAAEEVAEALVSPDVPLSTVSDQLQHLAETTHVAEQSELADTVALAKAVLASAEASQDEQMLEAAREHVSQVVADLAQTIAKEAEPEPAPEPFPELAPLVPQPVAAPVEATGLEEDDEMRQIFLEEAAEVVDDAQAALARLQARPDDVAEQTAVRRAFHTLKGSSRMVGLNQFGEAAWACEQLYNAQLATQQPAPANLLALTSELLGHFGRWREAIAAKVDAGWLAEPVVRVADALRLNGELLPLQEAVAKLAPPAAEAPVVQALSLPDLHDVEPLPLSADLATRGVDMTLEGATAVDVSFDDLQPPGPWERTDRQDRAADASLDEPETVPQALMIEPVSDHELIVLELEAGGQPVEAEEADGPLVIEPAPELLPPPKLWSSSEMGALDEAALEPLAVTFRDPSDFSSLDDGDVTQAAELAPADVPEPLAEGLDIEFSEVAEAQEAPDAAPVEDEAQVEEPVKVVGDLRISIPLFNIYLNEADEQSRRLSQVMGEWVLDPTAATPEDAIALAHSLAGNSATVGYQDLSRLARSLEHALERSCSYPEVPGEALVLFHDASEDVRRLLHQFAAGFLRAPADELLARLDAFEPRPVSVMPSPTVALPVLMDEPAPIAAFSPEPAPEPLPVLSDSTLSQPMPLGLPEFKELTALPEFPLALEREPGAQRAEPARAAWDGEEDIDAQDNVDAELFPIFEEEAQELLPQLATQIRQWVEAPENPAAAAACLRTLHTFKGGARLAGAMRLGEMAHQLESAIERLAADGVPQRAAVEPLEHRVDRLIEVFEALRNQDAQAYATQSAHVVDAVHAEEAEAHTPVADAVATLAEPLSLSLDDEVTLIVPRAAAPAEDAVADLPLSLPEVEHTEAPLRPPVDDFVTLIEPASVPEPAAEVPDIAMPVVSEAVAPEGEADKPSVADRLSSLLRAQETVLRPIDWTSLTRAVRTEAVEANKDAGPSVAQAAVRVRPQLLDQLVNHAGEVSITRTRLQAQVGQIRGSLHDLTDNLERLRQHLRDIELQAETQLSTRMEAARAASQDFDPLEFDRYTRFQELTRMMAESVNDVATVQRTLQRSLETAEDQLAAQARLTRDLQDDLLRTRMVEFDGLSDRLYRVVRQASKETGKQVRLDIVGGATEIDRGVLERMTGSFEHMLRNCVSHGIESPDARVAAGKDATGQILVALRQEGNEVSVEVRDDGAGLNLDRIRERALAMGLISNEAQPAEAELAQLIFTPGFSTAETVTELAGRGIGMDVVRADVNAMGGRIETATTAGQGTSFKLILPLTTAVTKVVMLRCGTITVAVPTHLIEMVRRAKPEEVETAYRQGHYGFADLSLPFYWLGALLEHSARGLEGSRSIPVVIVRSAQQRVALHVDEVLGNQEVVVKNLGPQLARLPGLAGMTLLASGAVSLIYNPVALATVYGERASEATRQSLTGVASGASWLTAAAGVKPGHTVDPEELKRPLVMVVDDSLTVRRVTQRLLAREGYRVKLAKDGLEALELLAQERPAVVLSDIEMPKMDGFDLVRNIRADQKLAELPIIMITSRIAQKHRDYAKELGVDHYLGKPYGEEELLALVARYAQMKMETS
ncbi:MAG: hypothetical protein RI907_2954 [Pseudomonadota bacterium]